MRNSRSNSEHEHILCIYSKIINFYDMFHFGDQMGLQAEYLIPKKNLNYESKNVILSQSISMIRRMDVINAKDKKATQKKNSTHNRFLYLKYSN